MGQYGKILKVMIKTQTYQLNGEEQFSAYITYTEEVEAAHAIVALQDFKVQNHLIKASFGTSKYCSYFIRNVNCTSQNCVFQHSIAKPEDTFTSDEIQNSNVSQHHFEGALKILEKYLKDIKNEKPLKKKSGFPHLKSFSLKIQR